MRTRRTRFSWTVYILAALLAEFHSAGCGSRSTQQKQSRAITEITISPADAVLSVSSTLQLQATGKFSDGSTSDVSSSVSWSSSDTSALSVNATGLVTAVSVGRIQITATSGSASGKDQISVILGNSSNVPRFAFVPNMADGTLSSFTVNASTGQLRHNGYQLVGHIPSFVAVDPRAKFVYVANSDSNNISAFSISTAGQLTPVPGQPFADEISPLSLVIDPTGSFLYSANSGSGNIQAYSIDSQTGELISIQGSPFAAAGVPSSLAIDPLGKFLYVANGVSNNVSAYAIDAKSGALLPVQGSPFVAGSSPSAIAVDPAGAFVYVANSASSDVSVFDRDSASGVLAAAQGSPFPTGSGQEISGVATSPDGQILYVSNFGSGNVSALSVGAGGKLTPVAGSPFPVDSSPRQIRIDPTGKFAYVPLLSACEVEVFSVATNGALSAPAKIHTRQQAASIAFAQGTAPVSYTPKFLYATNISSNNLSAFKVDANTGSLSAIAGTPFATGANPFGVAVDPWGKFVYVSNGFNSATNRPEKSISGFAIQSDGTLAQIVGSTFPAGAMTAGLTTDPSGRFLYAANFSDGTLSAYTIDFSTGALTPVPGSPFAVNQEPQAVKVDPTGQFLFVGMLSYKIDPTSGALTPLESGRNGNPSDIAIDPTGKFIYYAFQGQAQVTQYSIDAVSGDLTFVGSTSPPPTSAAVSLGVEPTGKFVISDFFEFSPGPTVNSFAIDPVTGALPATPSRSVIAGADLFYMTIDPSGKFFYVADQGASPTFTGRVWAFSLNTGTGELTPVSSSPFSAGTATGSVAVAGTIQ
jgi:6-phosphogluconolactonase (cycloisomerase 2 family)